jgi:hypothetical protein
VISQPLFGQAYNPYSYVENNPLNQLDPSGLSSEDVGEEGHGQVDDGPPQAQSFTVIQPAAPIKRPRAGGAATSSAGGAPAGGGGASPGAAAAAPLAGSAGVAAGTRAADGASSRPSSPAPSGAEWSAPSPAWNLVKDAWNHALDDTASTGSRGLAVAGAAVMLPLASVESASNSGWNSVLALAGSMYDASRHYGRAAAMYGDGNEAWLDHALQGGEQAAWGVAKAAGEVAMSGGGGKAAFAGVKALTPIKNALGSMLAYVGRRAPQGNVFSTAFSVKIPRALWGTNRETHFQYANLALEQAKAEIPVLREIVKAEWGKSPPQWTWQHATFAQAGHQRGWLFLVPRHQHTSGSIFWRALHPLRGGAGGYAQWAIPAGARRN